MAVQAVRYSLAETDELFDRMLRTLLVKMLETMQRDPELEIRRLAMTTLNSAVHNKPDILLPSLPTFMPFVFAHTIINRDLIREVKLGPFTHIVDDGLELRKVGFLCGDAWWRCALTLWYPY
jgi:cullin-associated NEDD8-dissociated protein 1